jgi:hypothetical protein
MFIKLTEKDCKQFNLRGVHWASVKGGRDNVADIHKSWLDKCVESTLVKKYTVNEEGYAEIEFHEKPTLFKVYKKTIKNEHNRGVIIHYCSALGELYQKGYDGWQLDLNHDLYGKYLEEYLQAMGEIAQIQSNIKSYEGRRKRCKKCYSFYDIEKNGVCKSCNYLSDRPTNIIIGGC